MNSMENKFDKIMKTKMESYEVLPDEDFWDNIESTMVRKRNMFYIRIVLLICSIILIAFFAFKRYSTADTIKPEELEKTTNPTALPEGTGENSSGAQQNQALPVKQKSQRESAEILSTQAITTNAVDSIKNISVTEENKENSSTHAVVVDTTNVKVSTPTNNTPKKVVKKPVYIIKQDTIYKVDTLKTKKKKNN